MVGVLALQGDIREHAAALAAVGAKVMAVRSATELDAVDGLIIPGGESTAMWKLAMAFELFEPVRTRLAEGLPAYGSCAGMIMLADHILDAAKGQQTFGGIAVSVRRNAFGRQADSFEAPVTFAGIEGVVPGVFIRAPWVESIHPDARDVEVLGCISEGPAAGRVVAVRQGNVLATSFHPELTGDHRVHGVFVEMLRKL
jgi:5'-phosphate synthase pdxT subunit